jgi:hypothetical protein
MSAQPETPETLQQTQIRAAKNQSLFREVNERIEEVRQPSTLVEFVCECTLEGCSEIVELTEQEYESVRSHSNGFAVRPGHVVPQVEVVVDGTDRYQIVSKIGAGAPIAEKLDPRQRKRHLRAVPEPPA